MRPSDFKFKYGTFNIGLTPDGRFDDTYFTKKMEAITEAFTLDSTSAQVPDRKIHNQRILGKYIRVFNAMIQMLREGWTPKEAVSAYHTYCIDDFEIFCVAYMILDNGLPAFPAPWQSEMAYALETQFPFGTILSSRKIGKSAFFVLRNSHIMCKYHDRHVTCLAPTDAQTFVMQDIYKAHQKSMFLMEEFIMPRSKDVVTRGTFNQDKIVYGRNGSTCEGHNLNINAGGDTKRGIKGNDAIVDEWPTIEKDVLDSVVLPFVSDAYSKKTLAKAGTPSTKYNPDLPEEFENERKKDNRKVVVIDWMDGVLQGSPSPDYMKEIFGNMGYNIDCPLGIAHGVCIPRIMETNRDDIIDYFKLGHIRRDVDPWKIRYNKRTNQITYPDDPSYRYDWYCHEQCMMNPKFAEEYGAQFGRSSNDFFSDAFIDSIFKRGWYFYTAEIPEKGKFIISVDLGKFVYNTEILVFEKLPNRLRCVYWKEIPPTGQTMEADGSPPTYWPIIEEIYYIFDKFNQFGGVERVYVDVSTNSEVAYNIVMGNSRHKGIPRPLMYQTEAAKKRGIFGKWGNSGPENSNEKIHFQSMGILGKIEFPYDEELFRKKFTWELKNCVIKSNNVNYIVFSPPTKRNGRIDILDAASQASLEIDNNMNYVPASHGYFSGDDGIHIL